MTDRLTKANWIAHGLRTLTNEGVEALKVGPMSMALNVSRGSFYWHFHDIADFRSQLLQSWKEQTTDQVIRQVEAASEPERLKHLLTRAFDGRLTIDRAIRSWAIKDETVAAVVVSVDARRIAYIANLLVSSGVEELRAQQRATFLYWAWLGQAIVVDPGQAALAKPTLDEICDLFET